MSADPIIGDRVYQRIKADLVRSRHAPGSALNVHAIATELAMSISPVRDSLHRLLGEGMVDARPGGGFQIPLITEASARELYDWHCKLIIAAVDVANAQDQMRELVAGLQAADAGNAMAMAKLTGMIFAGLTNVSSNRYQADVVSVTSERLFPLRLQERIFPRRKIELRELIASVEAGNADDVRSLIATYHRKRINCVTELVRSLYAPPPDRIETP